MTQRLSLSLSCRADAHHAQGAWTSADVSAASPWTHGPQHAGPGAGLAPRVQVLATQGRTAAHSVPASKRSPPTAQRADSVSPRAPRAWGILAVAHTWAPRTDAH